MSSEVRLPGRFRANDWVKAFVGLFVLLLIPYYIAINENTTAGAVQIKSIFFVFSSGSSSIALNPVSVIAAVNLILVVVPSLYLFYRRTHRAEGESLGSLYAITAVLTTVVLLIVDAPAFYTTYQRDPLPVSAPNLQFLPSFGILVIIFYVLYPAMKEANTKQIRVKLGWPEAIGPLAKLKTLLPSSVASSLCVFLFLLPTVAFVSLTPNPTLLLFASFYRLDTSAAVFGNWMLVHVSFYICGMQVTTLVVFGMITNILLFVVLVLYLEGRVSRRTFILMGVVSIIPTLFFSFEVLFTNTSTYGIPLPLLQIVSVLIMRQTEKASVLLGHVEETRRRPEHVTVPLRYVLQSMFRRHSKSENTLEPTENEATELKKEESSEQ